MTGVASRAFRAEVSVDGCATPLTGPYRVMPCMLVTSAGDAIVIAFIYADR